MVAIVGGAELGLGSASGQVLGGKGQLGSASQGGSGEGVTVNAVTGNLTLQRLDELLKGLGPDVRLIRTYNSQGAFTDDNGDNWRIGFSRQVYGLTGVANAAGSTVKRLGEDGAEVLYTYDVARGSYVTTKGSGAYDLLAYNSSTKKWTWTDGDTQAKEVYDSLNSGRLEQVTDITGRSLSIAYNTAGLVSSIADSNGETVQVVYDTAAGKTANILEIRTVTSGGTLTRVRYGYDTANRLTQVIVDLSPEDNSIADNKTYITNYTYVSTSKRLASIEQSDGSVLQFTYVLVGSDYRVQTVKDVRGSDIRTTTFTYNTSTRKTTVTDPLGQITELTYDVNGQLLSVKSPAVTGGQATTTFVYDVKGNVTSIVDARGNTISYTYDANGNRTQERDVLGNTVRRTFDAANRLVTETAFAVSNAGGAPATPLTTRYVYSASGLLRFVLSAEGAVTEYRYNALGQQINAITYLNDKYSLTGLGETQSRTEAQLLTWAGSVGFSKTSRIDTTYDVRGQVGKVTTYAAVNSQGNGILDGTQSAVQYIYDQAGNLLQTISPRGVATTSNSSDYVTSYTYDGLGRQLTTTDATGRLTTVVYDNAGRKAIVTLANGLVTATTHDQGGNVVAIVRSGSEGALGSTNYTYNKLGNLVAQADPSGTKTYLVYDAMGRTVGSIDGAGSFTEYVYNLNGQLAKTIRYTTGVSAQTLTSAATNPAALSLNAVRPAATMTDRIEYSIYDQAGRLVKSIDAAGGVIQHKYDGAGRLVEKLAFTQSLTADNLIALAGLGAEVAASDVNAIVLADPAQDRRTRLFYSADGQLLATLDAEGYLSENIYNAAGQLTQTTRYSTRINDPASSTSTLDTIRPTVVPADQTTFFLYNAKSQLVATVDAEGYLTENQYDLDGNKTATIRYSVKVSNLEGRTLQELRPSVSADDQKQLFIYDALNRLVQADSLPDGLVTAYEYDLGGNLIKTTKALGAAEVRTETRRFDSLGRVTQELSAEGAKALLALGGSATQAMIEGVWNQYALKHSYDGAGRRISTLDAMGGKTLFYYDADGRLTHTINALGEVVESTHSMFGDVVSTRRYGVRLATNVMANLAGGVAGTTLFNALAGIKNQTLDSVEVFSYGARGELRTRTDALGNETLFTYNAFTQVIRQSTGLDAGGGRLYEAFLYDRRGYAVSERQDTNSAGQIVAQVTSVVSRTYDAFGRLTNTVDARGNSWATTYDRLGRSVATSDPGSPSRVMTYDAFGRVLTRQDALGKVTTFTFNPANRSVSITSPEGIVTTTTTNRHGEVVSVADGRGNITSYTYDANGQLKTVTSPSGVTSHTYDRAGRQIEVMNAAGIKTAYEYDAVGRVLARTVDPTGLNLRTSTFFDAKGQAAWQKDANGVWTQTLYDLNGQVTSVVVDPLSTPSGTSTQGTLTLVSNSAGLNLRTTYTHNATGQTLTVEEGAGTATAKLTSYGYDNLGRLVRESIDPDGLNVTTQYSYDANGNMVSKTDALGNVSRFVYDEKNQNTYSVDANGAVSLKVYDHEGRVVRTTRYASSISLTSPTPLGTAVSGGEIASRLTLDAEADRTTRTIYNGDGKARYQILANNLVVGFKYDAAGNVVETTRYATAFVLPAGTLALADVTGLLVTNANDQVERTVYDAANRATFHVDAAGFVTQSVYDALGRVVKSVRYAAALSRALAENVAPQLVTSAPSTGAYVLINAAKDQVVRTVFDDAGRVRFEVNGEGYVVEHRYDAQGQETSRIQYGAKLTLADGVTETAIVALLPTTAGTADAVQQRVYDKAGRVTRTINAEGVITLHVLNAAGQETETIVAYGTSAASSTRRVFDSAGRVVEETLGYGAPGATASTSRYVLDALGNRIQVVDPRGVELTETNSDWALATRIELGYVNTNGTAKTIAQLTTLEKTALKALYTTNQQFDGTGKIIRLTDPLGTSIQTQYDAFGNAVKVTDQRGYSGYFYFDKQNNLFLQVDPEGYATQTFYNAFGGVEKIIRYSGKVVGSLTAGDAPTIGAIAQDGGAYLLENAATDQKTLIEHDKRNLQTKIIDAQGTYETMAYDAFGNKITYRNKVGGIFSYTHDKVGNVLNETQPITSLNSSGLAVPVVKSYLYDARGNITRLTEAVGLPEQRITNFQYDRLDRQTRKISEAFSTFNPVTQANVSVTPTEIQKYDARGNLIEVVDVRGNRTLYYYDALNRQTAQISSLGQLTVWQYNDGTKPVAELAYTLAVSLPASAGGVPPVPSSASEVRQKYFVYDPNNRLLSTRVPNVTQAQVAPGASNFSIVTSDLVSRSIYDATGNEIQTIDARGGSVISYYDRLGRKVLQVDAENFVTAWQYDENGNVVQQIQYANKLSLLATTSSDPISLAANLNSSPDNRVTQFSYDKLGRITEKQVLNVSFGQVNATNGGLTTATATGAESFTYDGLGNILSHSKAASATEFFVTNFSYDSLGRALSEKAPSYVDYQGVTVRPQTDYSYNGLGLVRAESERGLNNSSEADDRITRYVYTVGGLLASQTDPTGALLQYRYDAAGNVTQKTLIGRRNADNAVANDVMLYQYNALNQQVLSKDLGSSEIRETRYNAYGEVTGKRLNGGGAGGLWQETISYDQTGRVWLSNQGDGVYKAYLYDANGNATLQIQSAGADFSSLTREQVLALPANQTFITISQYDRRNQLADTYQPKMPGSQETVAVSQFVTEQVGIAFSGGNVTLSPSIEISGRAETVSNAIGSGTVNGDISINGSIGLSYLDSYTTNYMGSFSADLPDLDALGSGGVRIVATPYINGVAQASVFKHYAGSPDSVSVDHVPLALADQVKIEIHRSTVAGDLLLASTIYTNVAALRNPNGGQFATRNSSLKKLVFSGLPSNTSKMVLFIRPMGSSDGWQQKVLDKSLTGTFAFDWSSFAEGEYEIRTVAFDASGNSVNSQTGAVVFRNADAKAFHAPIRSGGGAGFALMDNAGVIQFMQQGANATSLTVRYRAGSGGAWTSKTLTPATVGGSLTPGWFSFNPAAYGLSGTYDFVIEARDAYGNLVNSANNTFTTGNAASVYEDIAGIKNFSSPVVNTSDAADGVAGAGNATATLGLVLVGTDPSYGLHTYNLNTQINIPKSDYPTRVVVSYAPSTTTMGLPTLSGQVIIAANQQSGVVQFQSQVFTYYTGGVQTVTIYRQTPAGEVLVSSKTFTTAADVAQTIEQVSSVSLANIVDTGKVVVGVGDTTAKLDFELSTVDSGYGLHTYDLNTQVTISPHEYPTRVQVKYAPVSGGNTPTLVGEAIFSPGQSSGSVQFKDKYMSFYDAGVQTISVYRQTPDGEVLVSTNAFTTQAGVTRKVAGVDVIDFTSQPLGTDRLYLMSRPVDSNAGWTVSKLPSNGSGFRLNWSSWQRGVYEFQYVALDIDGNILNSEAGTMTLRDAAPVMVQTPKSPAGGLVVMDTTGALQILGQGSEAQTLTVMYRQQGTGDVWQSVQVNAHSPNGTLTPGWFRFDPAANGLSGNYEFMLNARDASGDSLNRVQGTFTTGNAGSVSSLKGYQNLPEVVHFTGQPTATDKVWLSYRLNGSTGAYTKIAIPKVGTGAFDWDASSLVTDHSTNKQFEYTYEAYDAGGLLLNRAGGVLQLGLNPGMISHASQPSAEVKIMPTPATARKLSLYYRTNGSTGSFVKVDLTRTNATTPFSWDAQALVPAGQTLSLEYYYTLFTSTGASIPGPGGNLVHAEGVIHLGANTSSSLGWVVGGAAQVEATVHRSQEHNAFGEVVKEVDGRNLATDYAYNTLGLMTQKAAPETDVTLSNGFIQRSRPTTKYHYDLSGRLVAVDDPNGKRNTLSLVKGSGLDGSQAQVAAEFHADGGVKRTGYDVFGDARKLTDEIGRITLQEFDAAGRLIKLTRPQRVAGTASYIATALTETYEYDQAGNRIATTNALGKRERTYFDSLGRVTQSINFAGLTTAYDYSYLASTILGVGGRAVGGYSKTTTLADGHVAIDHIEYFGRTTWHQDYGDHTFTYGYNHAGWLTQQSGSTGQSIVYGYFANGFVKRIQDNVTGALTQYEYDAEGNRTRESYTMTVNGQQVQYQVAEVTYDELNRVKRILDPKADITYEYDANSNRRRILSVYNDPVSGQPVTRDAWYAYDSMNRFTVSMGALSGGVRGTSANSTVSIVAGTNGVQVSYNSASERMSATYADGHVENYTYTADGHLEDTRIDGVLRARRVNDALGRVTTYTEFNTSAASVFSRTSTYDDNNQLTTQQEWSAGSNTKTTYYDYYDAAGTTNNAGPLYTSRLVDGGTTVTTYYTYEWWDDAKQIAITQSPYNRNAPNWKSGYSNFSYNVNGHITQVKDVVGGRTLNYTTDAQGLILTRNETATGVNMSQKYFYLDGKRVGDMGNGGPEAVSYAEELAARSDTRSRKEIYKNWTPISSANFDQNYQAINSGNSGATATSYTARTGDTLQSIAAAMWGDSSMWYLIADANGLKGSETLQAGRVLVIPNKVNNINNSSSTYSVYDAGEAMGDTSPTLPDAPPPPKPKKKGCGGLAAVIVIVVAIVVTVYTAGAASGLFATAGSAVTAGTGAAAVGASGLAGTMTVGAAVLGGTASGIGIGGMIAAGVVAGAVGSIVSQGLAIGLGIQDKFSWGAVAQGAIGAGVGVGVSAAANAGTLGVGLQRAVASSVVGNVATQGIAVATGLQEKFSWTAVAASAVGGAVGYGVGKGFDSTVAIPTFGSNVARGTLTSMANGGTQSLLAGQKPNWALIAADSFGSGLGNSTVEHIRSTASEAALQGWLSRATANVDVNQNLETMSADISPEAQLLGPRGIEVFKERLARFKNYESMTERADAQRDFAYELANNPDFFGMVVADLSELGWDSQYATLLPRDRFNNAPYLANQVAAHPDAVVRNLYEQADVLDAVADRGMVLLFEKDAVEKTHLFVSGLSDDTIRYFGDPQGAEGISKEVWKTLYASGFTSYKEFDLGMQQGVDRIGDNVGLVLGVATLGVTSAAVLLRQGPSRVLGAVAGASSNAFSRLGGVLRGDLRSTGLVVPVGVQRFDRKAIIEGFQDHHMLSDKNKLTKEHELIDLGGLDLQSRQNKIFLPTAEALHPTRSIHNGRHTTQVSRNLAEQMDAVVEVGRQQGWKQPQYKQALDEILLQERQLLRSGDRALNRIQRPWAQ